MLEVLFKRKFLRPILFLYALTFGLACISQTKLVLNIIERGKYPYDYPLSAFSCVQQNEDNRFVSQDTERCIPQLFSAYYYPRAKMDKYGRWSFFVTEIIKNYGISGWQLCDHASLINLFLKDSLFLSISFEARDKRKSPSEGQTSYGRNDIELNTWSSLDPNLYNLVVKSFSDSTKPGTLQKFKRKIGIRSVEYQDGDLLINNKSINRYVLRVDSKNLNKEAVVSIRKTHANIIIAENILPSHLLTVCDSIGLMVIQKLGPENIQDTTSFLTSYFEQYTHPSLIAWNVSDSHELVQILSELDPKRPIIDLKTDYQKWDELDSADRLYLMHKQQPYSFWFNRQEGTIKLLENHDFYDLEMKIEWSVFQDGVNVEAGQFQFDENIEAKIESLQNLDPSLNLIISLKAAENKLHYRQGDLISWDEFYFLEKRDYVETRKKIF